MTEEIWKMIGEVATKLHPDRVAVVAGKVSGLESVEDFEKVRSSFGPGVDRMMIDRLGQAWRGMPSIKPNELSAALRGASETATILEKREAVDMVWTGPSTGLVPSRHTEQVLLEVIGFAKHRIFIVSFVAYDIEPVIQSLQSASERCVKIDILLESSKVHGGKIDIDSIETFKKRLPSANMYCWGSVSKTSEKWTGAVHAKCAVSDGQLAFITSANLTRAAMERNMELGVLVRGGSVPEKLERHLEALIVTGVIEKI
ncbi:MAG: DISARM system phospholipase D-like protein DrmC [Pseudomonadota bacterium]